MLFTILKAGIAAFVIVFDCTALKYWMAVVTAFTTI